ncbi:hypothetical protein OZN62_09200 [Aurantiacibacter sp. MUD11]|uniref:hypothetical protein n=1 Tax=Aurantiacibacter sp. MUD11 TaxID=3003265 RepID=UPI0022AA17C6|nr:hypothetical protein [Aurantiacibacter sp. MUD11]WAT17112.1 hypothetical protein OZN62_09200 [Aurantiacibacter sp. MUD11]
MRDAAMHKQPACQRHGGTFETSPRVAKGEVSLVQPPFNNGEKRAFPDHGTAPAIDYSNLGVPADLPKRTGRGGARNRADRESHALHLGQVANLRDAFDHSAVIGLPFTRMITIHWEAAGVPLAGMAKATGAFIGLMSKTLARYGCATAYVWVHEGGERKGGHCHMLVHVPAELTEVVSKLQRGWLRRITGRAYRKGVILSRPIGGRRGMEVDNPELHAVNLEVAFGYICKAASQTVLDHFDIDRLHEPGGLVIGKRCGTSQNTGAKARNTSEQETASA